MAQFLGLVQLNAASFESGAAADGEVLTADGNGGAAWEAPAGGDEFNANAVPGIARATISYFEDDEYPNPSALTNDFQSRTGRAPVNGDIYMFFVAGIGRMMAFYFDFTWLVILPSSTLEL